MFVTEQDSSIFRPSHLSLKIINIKGQEFGLDVPSDCTADKLKFICLTRFGNVGDENVETSASQCSLVSVRLCKKLHEGSSLALNGVGNNDELLLIKNKAARESATNLYKFRQNENADGPDFDDISRATANLESKAVESNTQRTTQEGAVSGSSSVTVSPNAINYSAIAFARELQPIFVSLVEHSQRLLCLSADAAKLFASVQAKLREPLINSNLMGVVGEFSTAEESLILQLMDMGFERERARKALQLHHNVVSEAMDWLLVNVEDIALDSSVQNRISEIIGQGCGEAEAFVEPMSAQNTLALFREYNRRQFKPIERVKIRLMEMGFDEATAVNALRVCSNDESQALEFLLTEAREETSSELRGLEEDSDLLTALLNDPVIQLGLTNPATLFAFLSILDSPHSAAQWLNNAEVSPVLVQISCVYHAECSAKGVGVLKLKL